MILLIIEDVVCVAFLLENQLYLLVYKSLVVSSVDILLLLIRKLTLISPQTIISVLELIKNFKISSHLQLCEYLTSHMSALVCTTVPLSHC